jgi:hypothetical protein
MSDETDRPVPDAGDSGGASAATPAPAGQEAPVPPSPPPPPPPPLPPAVSPRRRSRRASVAGVVALVVVVGAVALVVGRGGDEPSAAEALERAQAAIAEADNFRMHSTSEDRSVTGDVDGAGSSTVYRSVSDVEVAGDDLHAVYDSGDWADETVSIAEGLYLRSADSIDELADEPWELLPPDAFDAAPTGDDLRDELLLYLGLDYDGDGEIDPDVLEDEYLEGMVVPGLAAYYMFGLGAPAVSSPTGGPVPLPAGLVEAFGSFEDAEVVSDGDGELVIAATRSIPPEVAEGIDVDLPPGRFEITLGEDDLPARLELTVDGTDAHYTETVEFSDWGADIAIGVPEGEIDETPWLDEEALAEARGTVQALAPTVLPDGLTLQGIDATSAEDAEEFGNEPCAQLMLSYMPPITDDVATEEWMSSPDYLNVYLLPQSCALEYDDTPFEPGEFGDLPSRDGDFYVEILVGETVVQFDTTYTSELPAMVASIQPFDLDAELARLAPLAEQMWNDVSGGADGGWFAYTPS